MTRQVTLNGAPSDLSERLPVTLISYGAPLNEPEGTRITTPLKAPLESVTFVASSFTWKLISTVSFGSKPLPLTVTAVPAGPEERESVMVVSPTGGSDWSGGAVVGTVVMMPVGGIGTVVGDGSSPGPGLIAKIRTTAKTATTTRIAAAPTAHP